MTGILFPVTMCSLLGYVIKNRRSFLPKCSGKNGGLQFVSVWTKFHQTFKRAMILRLPNFEPFAAPSKRLVGETKGDSSNQGQHYDMCLGAALAQNPGQVIAAGQGVNLPSFSVKRRTIHHLSVYLELVLAGISRT